MVEPHCSNFRVITTNVLSVRIFRKFTVNQVGSMIIFICSNYVIHSLVTLILHADSEDSDETGRMSRVI